MDLYVQEEVIRLPSVIDDPYLKLFVAFTLYLATVKVRSLSLHGTGWALKQGHLRKNQESKSHCSKQGWFC